MGRILVTGGAGFVGSHLADSLLEQGHTVRVLDDLSTGKRENLSKAVEFICGDVTNTAVVRQALDGIDACFHLAAIASIARSTGEWLLTHHVNLTGTINVFDQAQRLRNQRQIPVVYASTAAVYGNCETIPVGELRASAPLSAYGADKRACELHARIAGLVHGVPTIGLRFFNLYGPRQDANSPYSGVVAIFANKLACGEPVEIFGDGLQVRDFTYVGDAISALCRALPAATTEAPVFNVCTGNGTTVQALAEAIAALYGTELVIDRRPPRSGDVRISIGDPRRASERLGFRASTTLIAGLERTFRPLDDARQIALVQQRALEGRLAARAGAAPHDM